MSRADSPSEAECERRRRLAELESEHGPDWVDAFRPGSFGCHELLDRTHLLADTLERFVLEHPSCVQNPEWFALAWGAVKALATLYQRVGGSTIEGPDS